MSDWKKGDIAICVTVGQMTNQKGTPPPLRKDMEYIVQGVKICACGSITLDVGFGAMGITVMCCSGCTRKTMNEPIWWCSAKRFVKKDLRSKEEQIAEAIESENYELALEIKNK